MVYRDLPSVELTPTRILQVVGVWGRGGTETWLKHVLGEVDGDRFRMDFLVHTVAPSAFSQDVLIKGGQLIRCSHSAYPLLYALHVRRILREHGPYRIVHCHVHHFSGYVLWLAYRAGVPQRVVHSHCDTSYEDETASWSRRLYQRVMRASIRKYATCGLAASEPAGRALFGPEWKRDTRWRILHCGINLTPFRVPANRYTMRKELGISEQAKVLGHVGGFRTPKNHSFLIRLAAALAPHMPELVLLLVGDGPLRSRISQEAATAGIAQHVMFTGLRDDVRRLLAAMDVFVFPSLGEGLPLAVLEAQAAGVPCLLSSVITREIDVVPPLIRRVSLARPMAEWVRAVKELILGPSPVALQDALELVEKSPFSSTTSARSLEQFYSALPMGSDC